MIKERGKWIRGFPYQENDEEGRVVLRESRRRKKMHAETKREMKGRKKKGGRMWR